MATHLSVLYEPSLTQLAIKPDGIYLDCTFGRGGHSAGILQCLGDQGRLIALDRDRDAINSAQAATLAHDQRLTLHHCSFDRLQSICEAVNVAGQVNGILMDLGVSSPQLDEAERGFSFMRDGPLDMRMDQHSGLSAADYLAQVDEKTLTEVLFDYGEERFAKRIAHAIVEQRRQQPLTTTRQLAQLIEASVPFRDPHKHPATRSFQAIRIAVNQELEQIKSGLQQAVNVLAPGGRLVVISFHSLEDRLVKQFIRAQSGPGFNPGRLPIKEHDIARGPLTKIGKAIKASDEEVAQNPRARSAVLRTAEKR